MHRIDFSKWVPSTRLCSASLFFFSPLIFWLDLFSFDSLSLALSETEISSTWLHSDACASINVSPADCPDAIPEHACGDEPVISGANLV